MKRDAERELKRVNDMVAAAHRRGEMWSDYVQRLYARQALLVQRVERRRRRR